MRNRIKNFYDTVISPGREFREKEFIILTLMAEISIMLVFIGDLILGENAAELIILGMVIVVAPLITYFSVKNKRTDIGAVLITMGIVFAVLPICYFFGGGAHGGAPLWFAFSYLYIGLILSGKARKIMLTLLTIFVVYAYVAEYFSPDIVQHQTREMMFADAALSAIISGLVPNI